jgi:hypothetical protein
MLRDSTSQRGRSTLPDQVVMLKSILFPSPVRSFKGQRWVRISLRSGHLISMGLLLGGYAGGLAMAQLTGPLWWTIATGAAFVCVELYCSCIFLLQLKGIAVVVKALLLLAAWMAPSVALPCMVTAVAIGGVSSHMPGALRYFSPLHGKVIKE